jgi:arginyl-tRNA synthetase
MNSPLGPTEVPPFLPLQHDPLKLIITDFILETTENSPFKDELQLKAEDVYQLLVTPPQKEMGHYAFPGFTFSQKLKKSPAQIVQILVASRPSEETENQAWGKIFESVKNAGPYLNFFFRSSWLSENALADILSGKHFNRALVKDSARIMLEYSQPNTHKELHVGHMRNLSLGHALTKMHRYLGVDFLTATFPGDMGTHVAKCLWYLKNKNTEPVPQAKLGAYLGRMYSKAFLLFEEEKLTPQGAQNQLILTQIINEIEQGAGEYYDLWRTTRMWSIDQMKEIYQWAQVEFDYWYFESEVDKASVEYCKELLNQEILVESEGAVGMNLEEEKLGFCLLIKSDGTGLYATKDIELARRKFQDHNIDISLYLVDSRQSFHFAQVFKVLEKIGFLQNHSCQHLSYDSVELPDGAMSSRKGNIVPIEELIEKMEGTLKEQHLVRLKDTLTEKELEDLAREITLGAIKYGMLSRDPQKKIVFDLNEWLKLDGESGPYLQYVGARIHSLLAKMGSTSINVTSASSEEILGPIERDLIFKLSQFNQWVLSGCQNYRPDMLCGYLYDTAKLFNHFYAECPIKGAKTQNLMEERLRIAKGTAIIIEEGLKLLGIGSPKKM